MLRNVEIYELDALYRDHITKDFPPNEYPPQHVMARYFENSLQEGLFFLDEAGIPTGYTVATASDPCEYVLLSLLAVFGGQRGAGTGSRMLVDLRERYRDRAGILIEVENPDFAEDEDEKALRIRRIRFYERAGFCMLPEIEFELFKVPLQIMVLPLRKEVESPDAYIQYLKDIYASLLGDSLEKHLSIGRKSL